jgi:hypothetical protein
MLGIMFFDVSDCHGHLIHQPFFLKWRQTPEPGKRPVPVPGFHKLRLQPFMLRAARNYQTLFIACRHQTVFLNSNRKGYDTAYRKHGKIRHRTPVENSENKIAQRRIKSKYYFRKIFAFRILYCPDPVLGTAGRWRPAGFLREIQWQEGNFSTEYKACVENGLPDCAQPGN